MEVPSYDWETNFVKFSFWLLPFSRFGMDTKVFFIHFLLTKRPEVRKVRNFKCHMPFSWCPILKSIRICKKPLNYFRNHSKNPYTDKPRKGRTKMDDLWKITQKKSKKNSAALTLKGATRHNRLRCLFWDRVKDNVLYTGPKFS